MHHRLLRYRAVGAAIAAAVLGALMAAAPAAAEPQVQAGFPDVTEGPHKPAIEALGELGVFEGTLCRDGFCTVDPIKRSHVAVWLIRALEDGDPPPISQSRFDDVDDDAWWAPFVERLAELRITRGKTDTTFDPEGRVTRAQMASFLVRALDLEPAGEAGFVDIEGDSHSHNINALYAAGITVGCRQDPLRYCPADLVKRGHMATFLHRALNLLTYQTISAGDDHTCGIRPDDTVRCWGSNQRAQLNLVQGTYRAVAAGGLHTCGIRSDDSIACWGNNDFGQAAAPAGSFSAIAAGGEHSCAIRTPEREIRCWGNNRFGQLNVPRDTYRQVSAGRSHTCAIRTDNSLECWGYDDAGQTAAPSGSFSAVSVGASHTCAIRTDDTVVCWGTNVWGQRRAPQGTFRAVAAGETHSCGIRSDRTVVCWGSSFEGETDAPSGAFNAISLGERYSCGLRTDGTAQCWGRNNGGLAASFR